MTSIDLIVNAISQHIGTSAAEAEFRMHPDDWDELRKSSEVKWSLSTDLRTQRFYGLHIVLDETAPRLPRKPK